MANWKEKYKEDYILMVEAGYIAVNQADEDSAFKLFRAAEQLNTTDQLAKMGIGYLYLHMLDLKNACKVYEEVLEKDPSNEMAKAMLGIALSLDPNMTSKAEKVLHEAHHSKNQAIQTLSDTALDFVNKFIKKAPSPVEGHQKRK